MKLVFFQQYGVGDLFESREFVRDFIPLAGEQNAVYAHRKLPGFFDDLPQISSMEMLPEMYTEMDRRTRLAWLKDGQIIQRNGHRSDADELWVNTHIGCCGTTYVLDPGCGCTLEKLYAMWNDYLREAQLPPLPRAMVDYLPQIDYGKINIANVVQWLESVPDKSLALICNGPTGSGHALNFDMSAMVNCLPVVDNQLFLFTERCATNRPDVAFTDDITGRSQFGAGYYGHCDFNAISYLSRRCSVIAGRCSGAQMGTQTLENWRDASKTLVCFTNHRNGAAFVFQPENLGLAMRLVWSPTSDPAAAAAVMQDVLKR